MRHTPIMTYVLLLLGMATFCQATPFRQERERSPSEHTSGPQGESWYDTRQVNNINQDTPRSDAPTEPTVEQNEPLAQEKSEPPWAEEGPTEVTAEQVQDEQPQKQPLEEATATEPLPEETTADMQQQPEQGAKASGTSSFKIIEENNRIIVQQVVQ